MPGKSMSLCRAKHQRINSNVILPIHASPRRWSHILVAALLLAGLSACTALQPYQPARKTASSDGLQRCLARPEARCLRTQAFDVAEGLSNPVVRDELMRRIAANQLLHGELDAGLRSATRIRDLALRYGLLERIHNELLQSSPSAAMQLTQRARELNRTHLPYNRAIGDFYLTLMQLAEQARDTPLSTRHALQAVDTFVQRYSRHPDRLRAQFAVALFDKGQSVAAHALAGAVQDLHWKGYAYSHFMKGGDGSPRLRQVLEPLVAHALAQHAFSVLQQISVGLAHRREYQRALQLVEKIDQPYYRAQGLCDIASVAAGHSRAELAKRLWREALRMSAQADGHRPTTPDAAHPPVAIMVAEAMKQLAVEYARQGQTQQALAAAAGIARLSPVLSDAAHARLTSEMALQGQFVQARHSAAQIVAAPKKALALANLAIRLHATGQTREAYQLIFALDDRPAMDHALGEIALKLAEQGEWQRALALLDKIQLAFKYADTLNRLSVLRAQAATPRPLALATPSHMRIIRASIRTRP